MIILLILMIVRRGAKPLEAEKEETVQIAEQIPEVTATVASQAVSSNVSGDAAAVAEEETAVEKVLYATTNTNNGVNVRKGPGTDNDKVGKAAKGQDFRVKQVLSSGWVLLDYKGSDGYVHGDYMDFYYLIKDGDGNETKEEVDPSKVDLVKETEAGTE